MGQRWVTVAGTIRAIAAVDAAVAARVFGSSDAIALGGWPGATTGRAWASYARFAEDVATRAIPDDVRVAMYDPESWDATPLEERLDPLGSIEAFCSLARSHGYALLVTPHPNLVSVPGSPHAPRAGESRESAYLRSGIVEVCAANADAVETQAQTLQRDPAAYRAFVANTARLAREIKPDVEVLSGLSTHPGYPASPQMLTDAWASVRDVVDGHYLSLARLRLVEVAASFLSATVADAKPGPA
jgi:hypothetical protein